MNPDMMKEKINWIMATQTPCGGQTETKPFSPPRPHCIREKHYSPKDEVKPCRWGPFWCALAIVLFFAIALAIARGSLQ